MFSAIRQSKGPKPRATCPVCGSFYVNEYNTVPNPAINLAVTMRVCQNQHEWEKYVDY